VLTAHRFASPLDLATRSPPTDSFSQSSAIEIEDGVASANALDEFELVSTAADVDLIAAAVARMKQQMKAVEPLPPAPQPALEEPLPPVPQPAMQEPLPAPQPAMQEPLPAPAAVEPFTVAPAAADGVSAQPAGASAFASAQPADVSALAPPPPLANEVPLGAGAGAGVAALTPDELRWLTPAQRQALYAAEMRASAMLHANHVPVNQFAAPLYG
jgi:hypothetical protein